MVSAAAAGQDNPYNLMFVVVNCLNRNHLSIYGYSRPTTPFLERFSRESLVFNNLVSPASWTPPVLRELFSATPLDNRFHLDEKWTAWYLPKLNDYPIGRWLLRQGYEYLQDALPAEGDRPFVAYRNIGDLHIPYDRFRRRGGFLKGASKALYKRLLSRIDEIALVDKPSESGEFPALLYYYGFFVRRTEIPAGDGALWDSLLIGLKDSGDSPAAAVSSALPRRLKKRLSQIGDAREMTLSDKRSVIRALNRIIRDSESPIGGILFGDKTYFVDNSARAKLDSLIFCGKSLDWEDRLLAANIDAHLRAPDSFLVRQGNRLALRKPLDRRQRALLRQIYREALEHVFPALTLHHPRATLTSVSSDALAKWRDTPGYAAELALLKDLYDANLADVDRAFSDSIDHLRRIGVLDKTVVVFMGDHGEAFMEHGQLDHASCYNEIISPPLLIRVPGRTVPSGFVKTQLRSADVLPTAIELMGLRLPQVSTAPAGVSLARSLAGAPAPDIVAFSRNYSTARSVRRNDGWKLIWEMGTDRCELYDLKNDPGEAADVSRDFPRVTAELEETLNRFLFDD